jgi:hypothetical protein
MQLLYCFLTQHHFTITSNLIDGHCGSTQQINTTTNFNDCSSAASSVQGSSCHTGLKFGNT